MKKLMTAFGAIHALIALLFAAAALFLIAGYDLSGRFRGATGGLPASVRRCPTFTTGSKLPVAQASFKRRRRLVNPRRPRMCIRGSVRRSGTEVQRVNHVQSLLPAVAPPGRVEDRQRDPPAPDEAGEIVGEAASHRMPLSSSRLNSVHRLGFGPASPRVAVVTNVSTISDSSFSLRMGTSFVGGLLSPAVAANQTKDYQTSGKVQLLARSATNSGKLRFDHAAAEAGASDAVHP